MGACQSTKAFKPAPGSGQGLSTQHGHIHEPRRYQQHQKKEQTYLPGSEHPLDARLLMNGEGRYGRSDRPGLFALSTPSSPLSRSSSGSMSTYGRGPRPLPPGAGSVRRPSEFGLPPQSGQRSGEYSPPTPAARRPDYESPCARSYGRRTDSNGSLSTHSELEEREYEQSVAAEAMVGGPGPSSGTAMTEGEAVGLSSQERRVAGPGGI